jgi:mannose-1-phosphate guanylyltransferase
MKALILAAGYGTRLGLATKDFPKPLIKVGEKPILDLTIRKLLEIGISEIIINTHFKAEAIEDFILSQEYPAQIILSYEAQLLGTLGTLRKHLEHLSTSDFLVMHSDNYFEDSLHGLVKAHLEKEPQIVATMATYNTENPSGCGVVTVDEKLHVTGFYEKVADPPTFIANAAIYVFSSLVKRDVISLPQAATDLSRDLIPCLVGRILASKLNGPLVDIGTPDGLAKANLLCAS